ncbi:ERO1-like protein [Dinothrombium tinctorium]|uniref:ERO1-like protein n=1 Tax=Dinothrombium tinctorium TaxID=1965070 RepID=A0A3S3P5M6_9ACAR|nr:ERO1-like protein [Dinothrombium tinctorium]RWS08528.1 ERO1-like protein [Dinothrombium tinctorium]RWS08567.1 ERO1-like protein [Dinothrombium tinctorium]
MNCEPHVNNHHSKRSSLVFVDLQTKSAARKVLLASLIVLISALIYSYLRVKTDHNCKVNNEQTDSAKRVSAGDVFSKQATFLDRLKHEHIDDFISSDIESEPLTISKIDCFNNFIKLNLNKKCQFWSDTGKCALRDCTIQFCDESKLPPSIVERDISEHAPKIYDCPSSNNELSQIDETVSSERVEAMDHLFECYEDDQEDGQYFDLSLNPERYTGKEQYIKNLYFLYLLELRALNKIESYLTNKVNWQSSGDMSVTKEPIKSLLKIIKYAFLINDLLYLLFWKIHFRTFKWNFNEKSMFKQEPKVAKEFAEHFRNITNIMDCVACDKCRLWGKVQIHGLGTAFKILIAEDVDKLTLHRHEIVTLINALARLSNSISHLDVFNKMARAS